MKVLSNAICEGSATGENIFLLEAEFTAHNIPWSNCLSLRCDNASVMTGNKKGVVSYLRGKQPDIYLSGCCLHLVHIAAHKGAQCLVGVEYNVGPTSSTLFQHCINVLCLLGGYRVCALALVYLVNKTC